VISAGIVGVCTALHLQRDGHTVTLVDPEEPGQQTSFGNACSISSASVMPTALPGLWRKLPGMILDPAGPVNIRWPYLPRLVPFLLAALRNTTRARLERNSSAIAALSHRAVGAYVELLKETGAEGFMRRNGALKVYETEAAFETATLERELLARNDCTFEILEGAELAQLEPGLAPIFEKAMFLPDSAAITNPGRMIKSLAETFARRGGRVVRDAALDADLGPRRAVLTRTKRLETEIIVLAAGPWSGPLSKKLGAPVKLEAERGYHVMLEQPPVPLERFVYFAERKFVLTPHEEGLRLTTGVEYAKVGAAPDYRRVRAMLPHAAAVMKGLEPRERSIWCGNRPTLPDSVPVIGRSPIHADVYLGFGHSHLGLTLGALTGRILADLAAGRPPEIDLTPYRPDR